MKKILFLDKIFILSILFLMPIDFFYPTAAIFREAGAKIFNLYTLTYLMVCLGIKGMLHWRNLNNISNLYFMVILAFGIIEFVITFIVVDYHPSNRTPEFQFFSQCLMFILFITVFNMLRIYFLKEELRRYVISIIPIAVILHLVIFGLEFFEIFNADNPGFLRYFRNDAGLIDRASGLMSEPSYFGVFAGTFIFPLIFICKKYKILNIAMSIIIFALSVIIQAKTFFIVIIPQIIYYIFYKKISNRIKIITGILTIILLSMAIYTINTSQVLNVQQNLSSANRLGSGLLGLNLAFSGLNLIGLGFGQFHFFYLPEYSPDFLLLSQEALDQMNNVNDARASTFSLPIRLLVETGILGLIVAVTYLYRVLKKFSSSKDPVTQLGLLFILASIGFLFTQDTYCLPSLAFGLALVTSQPINLINNNLAINQYE